MTDQVNIRDIQLDGVNLILEQRSISGNNLQDVINKISRRTKAG